MPTNPHDVWNMLHAVIGCGIGAAAALSVLFRISR